MNPKVIVVTPVYCTSENKRLPLLLQTLYWVRRQKSDYLHVVVDDGSTDCTPEFLDKIASKNPDMLICHKNNSGSSSSINLGVDRALSVSNVDFITVCHSHDVLLPRSLERRVRFAQETRAAMIHTDMFVFYDKPIPSRLVRTGNFRDAEELYQSLLFRGGGIPFPTMMWTRDLFMQIGGYDEEITSAEDWDIALRSAKEIRDNEKRQAGLHEPSVAYRIHDKNLMIQNVRDGTKYRCFKRILKKHLSGYEYQLRLACSCARILRAMIPENAKKVIRNIRDYVFGQNLQDGVEFIRELRRVDYEKEFR